MKARLALLFSSLLIVGCGNSQSHQLVRAVNEGSLNEVARLLDSGADPNSASTSGETVLAASIREKRYDVAAALVKHGAPPAGSIGGLDLLAVVVTARPACPVDLLRDLLRAGCSANTSVHGLPVLGLALAIKQIDCANALIDAGAELRLALPAGVTILHAVQRTV